VPLALLPGGTANILAKELNFRGHPGAAKHLLNADVQ